VPRCVPLAAQRTREVGIRMALGALKYDILGVGQGLVLVAIGLALGLMLSAALAADPCGQTRSLQSRQSHSDSPDGFG